MNLTQLTQNFKRILSQHASMKGEAKTESVRRVGTASESTMSSENDVKTPPIDSIRSKVSLTRDAARAISITALETIREGAKFMGVVGNRGNLESPFGHIDASIWKEGELPARMIEASYDYCEELTRIEAANFYHSFKYLPSEVRRSICAYYAFCRRADDIADGDYTDLFPGGSEDSFESVDYRSEIERIMGEPVLERGAYDQKMSQLFYYRKKLSTAYTTVTSTDPIFIALKDTVEKFRIPRSLLDDMISGMEDDLHRNRFQTFEDLYEYCYKVASTVGLVCIEIYGYDSPEAKDEAEAWGVYMQLINILRDVLEDSKRGRIYLPLDDLIRYGITEKDVLAGESLGDHPGWEPFCKNYTRRAKNYGRSAKSLLGRLDKQMRYSPAAMMAFYDSILRKIAKNEGDVFTERVQLSKPEKIGLAAWVYFRYRFLPV